MGKSRFFTTEHGMSGDLSYYTVSSKALGGRGDVLIYEPPHDGGTLPVVVLLHGVYGSHWVWAHKANIHRTLDEMIAREEVEPMILAMPSDGLFQDGSGYLKHKHADYERWIVEDVLGLVEEQEGVQMHGKSPIFISGLSMGGYGALRLGAKYPEVFSGFSGHSSITEFKHFQEFVSDMEGLRDSVVEQESVVEQLLLHRDGLRPFRFDCGTEDSLLEANRSLHEKLTKEGIDHKYEEFSGGHEWPYWTEHVRKSLQFFNDIAKNMDVK